MDYSVIAEYVKSASIHTDTFCVGLIKIAGETVSFRIVGCQHPCAPQF